MKKNILLFKTKYSIVCCVILFYSYSSYGQTVRSNNIWTDFEEEDIPVSGERVITPQQYRTLSLDMAGLQELLAEAPMEYTTEVNEKAVILEIPMPNGQIAHFQIEESPTMEAPLQELYPEIRTYRGVGIDDATATMRFDVTPKGFHAIVLSALHGTVYIDPYFNNKAPYYISHYKKKNNKTVDWQCDFETPNDYKSDDDLDRSFAGDCILRSYRIAIAATGEYTQFHGGTVASGLSAIVVTLNRVRGIYEREVHVTFVLVASNGLIIYTNPATDPYTNSDGFTMMSQNQANCDAVLGSANYDIGHVFSTGGGGVASLGVVCNNSAKARGVTGISSPIGDPFYVDFVAHEMGHQFGADHTFNGNVGSCSGGNRTGPTAYEPGSGSTIQAYAGRCSSQNIQSNNDDYFHAASLAQIGSHVTGSADACAIKPVCANTSPVVTAPPSGMTYNIPHSTPFMLTGAATDAENDTVTYCWEQYDLGPVQTTTPGPACNIASGPLFRTNPPTINPVRVFPNMADLASGATTTWEVLPCVARTMIFRETVRDNHSACGCSSEVDVNVITDDDGAFAVTSQNTAQTYAGNSIQTVTWNVANSDIAPVSCANVDILFSTDGGLTYPTTVATNMPNNGSALVTVPSVNTTTGRFMVKCGDNIFFNINSANITVNMTVCSINALAQNPTLLLDAMGNVTLTPADVDNGSSSSCGGAPFLAFETMSFDGEIDVDSPTDDFGPIIPYEGSAFTVPVSGDYTFNMTSATPSGASILIIWDDTPVPNSGYFEDRPEFYAAAEWQSDGTFNSSTTGSNVVNFLADKTYYMSIIDSGSGFGTFTLNLVSPSPIITTAANTTYTCNDIGSSFPTTLYAFDAAGNSDSATATVTVDGVLTTYTGGAWDNGAPNLGSRAVIDDNLSTGGTSIETCACDVNGSITVEDGDYLLVNQDITVNAGGSLVVDHQGSVVQVDDDASVSNGGTISVEKITPTMAAKSFMISGSPMTGETREGVFGPAYIVRNHVTSNFDPNPAVEVVSPGINNWADDNGNNWLSHAGLLNPGEGYMVFPQPDGSGSGSYTQTHNLGTLTNGVVDFTMGFNADQNSSPNILSNPYASAIDAEVFFDNPNNTGIDVLYFWEHNTPISVTYPGYRADNFSMMDISSYQEGIGGNPAASGGATPNQFVSSGQGFGVKPTAGGVAQFNNAMRVTGPNDSYRTNDPIVNRDRLWLNVYNDSYGLGSTVLIAFTENTSDKFISSEDVKRIATPVSLYSDLDSKEELGINALASFESSDAVYLGFSTQVKETQHYRISIHDIDGANMIEATVYLIDAQTGMVTNLSEGDYTFQSGESTYSKRFKIVFEYASLGNSDSALESITLYPNPTQNTVTIVSPQTKVNSATVYDVRGRKVSEVDFRNNTGYQIDLSSMEAAVYFIEIATENGTLMKRVMKK